MFTPKDFNLHQRMWLELLKYYDMSFIYFPSKMDLLADILRRMTAVSVVDIQDDKKELVRVFIDSLDWVFSQLILTNVV